MRRGGLSGSWAPGVAIGLIVALSLVGRAGAWESSGKWASRVVGYKINPKNNDVSDAKAVAALRWAAAAWTKQTQAGFRFRYDGTSTSTTVAFNNVNLVLFRDASGSSSTVRATTYSWKLGSTLVDADIVFWDKSQSFITQPTSCHQNIYIENTGLHEFGHVFGLDHSTVSTASMWGKAPWCSTDYLVLDPDDKAGARTLYPCSSAAQCDDALVCTKDVCSNSRCQRTAIAGCCTASAQCDDGKACTKDVCQGNVCKHTAIAGCCTANAQCDDGKACTKDVCQGNVCKHSAIASCCTANAQCDDGKACTKDVCQSNVCQHTAVPCDAGVYTPDARVDEDGGGSTDIGLSGGDGGGSSAADAGIVSWDGGGGSGPGQQVSGTGGCTLAPGPGQGNAVAASLLLLLLVAARRRTRLA